MQPGVNEETLRKLGRLGWLSVSYFGSLNLPLACFFSFAVSLGVCLWQNLLVNTHITVLDLDSGHYLESCRQLVILWQHFLSGMPGNQLLGKSDPWFSEFLMLDGPVLPLLAAFPFAIMDKLPVQAEWRTFVVLGAIWQACASVLVCVLTMRLTGKSSWGLVAGLCWGLYPAAIVASGHFLTETPTTVLLLAVTFFLSQMIDQAWLKSLTSGVFAGIGNGLLILLKPVLIPCLAIVTLVAGLSSAGTSRRLWCLTSVLVGLVLTVCPWFCFSKLLTGQYHLLPQRVPAYNLAKGCDLETDGWSGEPVPPVTARLAADRYPLLACLANLAVDPVRSTSMFLRKSVRLWAWPWNQFRQPVMGIPVEADRLWHIVLCVLSVFGVLLFLCLPDMTNARQMFVGWACLVIILGHFAYLPFEAITRYGYTAMPFVVILAAYFLSQAPHLEKRALNILFWVTLLLILACCQNTLPAVVSVVGSAGISLWIECLLQCLLIIWLVLILRHMLTRYSPSGKLNLPGQLALVLLCVAGLSISVAYAIDGRDAREWACTLMAGQSACREIELAGAVPASLANQPDLALVLVDGDATIEDARVVVNGHLLVDHPVSFYQFCSDEYWLLGRMRNYCSSLNMDLDQIQQWRAVKVPLAWLNLHGKNIIKLAAPTTGTATVFGDYSFASHDDIPFLTWKYFSFAKLCNAGRGADGRLLDGQELRQAPSVSFLTQDGFSRDKVDLSPGFGVQTGQYRLRLVLCFNKASKPTACQQVQEPPKDCKAFKKQIKPGEFEPLMNCVIDRQRVICVNRNILKAAASTCTAIDVRQAGGTDELIEVTGQARSTNGDSCFSVLPMLSGLNKNQFPQVMPHTPGIMVAGRDWHQFAIVDQIPCSFGLRGIVIGIYPGPWQDITAYGADRASGQVFIRGLTVVVRPPVRACDSLTLARNRLVIY